MGTNLDNGFADDRVDLAGHDAAAGLDARQLEFAKATRRAGTQQAHVVGDLHHACSNGVNPVICEAVVQVGAHVTGNNVAVRTGGQWGQLDLNVMCPMMAHNALESIRLLGNAARVFVDKCLDGVTANEETAAGYIEQSMSMATALNPLIGYDKAAEIAKTSFKTGRTVRELAYEMSGLSKDEVDAALEPRKQTEHQ